MAQANDKKTIEEQRLRSDALAKQENADLKAILELPGGEGIRFLRRVLTNCYMFSSTFTGNSATFRNEGKRAVALELIEMITQADALDELSTILINREAKV